MTVLVASWSRIGRGSVENRVGEADFWISDREYENFRQRQLRRRQPNGEGKI